MKSLPTRFWCSFALVVSTVLLAFVIRRAHSDTPQVAFQSLIIAMRHRDGPQLQVLSTPRGLAELKITFRKSWLNQWQQWAIKADTTKVDTFVNGGETMFAPIYSTPWLRFIFVKTSQGWKLNDILTESEGATS